MIQKSKGLYIVSYNGILGYESISISVSVSIECTLLCVQP